MVNIRKLSKRVGITLAEAGVFWFGFLSPVLAADIPTNIGEGAEKAQEGTGLPSNLLEIVKTVINWVLFIVGFAAVVMLIIGGIRYVVSAGSEDAVGKAKSTILYAIIGLVIAILAYAAVRFIFDALTTEPNAMLRSFVG